MTAAVAALSIAETAERTGVTAPPCATTSASRCSTASGGMPRDAGPTPMTTCELRRYVALVAAGDGTVPARLALLEAHRGAVRGQLADPQAAPATIEFKIGSYGGTCGP